MTTYIIAQSTAIHRPVYGPLTARQNATAVPMAPWWLVTKRTLFGKWQHEKTDPAKVISWLKSRGVDPLYNGYICLDWEPYIKYDGPFSETIAGYQLAYDTAKAFCPNAIVGFFGPPGVRARDNGIFGTKSYQEAEFWADYMAIADVLFVQTYISSRLPLKLHQGQRELTLKQIGIAVDSGKRVVSVLSWRMHAEGKVYPMPPEIQAELATMILEAYPSIDGLLQWAWGNGDENEYDPAADLRRAELIEALWPVVRK